MEKVTDLRSNRCVFVSHCILAQCVRANGLAKIFPAGVKPVIQFCLDNDINIMQMPCPETLCSAGGLGRDPHGKKWYDNNGLRETASKIAKGQAEYMYSIKEQGFDILAIIGMEFSPACAVSLLNRGPVIVKDSGIYIEELRIELEKKNLDIRMVGVNLRAMNKLNIDLHSLIGIDLRKVPKTRIEKSKTEQNVQQNLFD